MTEKCCARVWDDFSRKSYPCQRAAKYSVDGQQYCGIHNPEAKARRTAKFNEKWQRKQDAVVSMANKRKQDEANAAKYLWLRDRLYEQTIVIGEARLDFQVVGACPSVEEFDAAIEQQMAEDARYQLTNAGRAEIAKRRALRGVDENATDAQANAYVAALKGGE